MTEIVDPVDPAALRASVIVKQFIRYCAVGGVAFLADFGVMTMLKEWLGWHYLAAATCGFIIGLAVNYALSVRWVFGFRRVHDRHVEFILFGVIGLIGLVLNNLSLYALTDYLHIDYRISKMVTTAVILLFNFSVRRMMLFSQ